MAHFSVFTTKSTEENWKKNIQIKIEIMIALEQMDERQTFHDVVNQIQPQKQQEKNPKHI